MMNDHSMIYYSIGRPPLPLPHQHAADPTATTHSLSNNEHQRHITPNSITSSKLHIITQ